MEKYIYKGSSKENHHKIIDLGRQFGIQHIRKMSTGEKIAEMANQGVARAQQVCSEYPELFSVE